MQGSANLNVMIQAARKAGRLLVKDFREVENLQVSSKAAGDFVSRADIAAEAAIREILTEARPNYGWLGEESDPVEGKDPTRRWIVDPLDGTTNFLHGMPHWAVSIALEFKGEIVAGVVFDPAKDELFIAEKGMGTFMNGTRLRVSNRHDVGLRVRHRRAVWHQTHPARHAARPGAAYARLRRCAPLGGGARWTWPMSRPGAMTGSGNANCSLGTWPPGCCWCAKRAASPAPSARAKASSSAAK